MFQEIDHQTFTINFLLQQPDKTGNYCHMSALMLYLLELPQRLDKGIPGPRRSAERPADSHPAGSPIDFESSSSRTPTCSRQWKYCCDITQLQR